MATRQQHDSFLVVRILVLSFVLLVFGRCGSCYNGNTLTSNEPSPSSTSSVLTFDAWNELHDRVYINSDEEAHRRNVYNQNVIRWNELNQIDGGATYGPEMEPYADRTPSEFAALMGNLNCNQHQQLYRHDRTTTDTNGLVGTKRLSSGAGVGANLYDQLADKHRTLLQTKENTMATLSTRISASDKRITYIDWRSHNGKAYVTPPKNQGPHGTCWSFAASENLEGLNVRQGHPLVNISEQEFISCCDECQGRTQEVTFEWLVNTTGGRPALEDSYPYDGNSNVSCRASDAPRANVTLHYWDRIVDDDGSGMNILLGLSLKGPMSMGADARCFFGYQGGIIRNCSAVPDGQGQRNHAVSLVAAGADIYRFDREDGGEVDFEMVNYFTIKNRYL